MVDLDGDRLSSADADSDSRAPSFGRLRLVSLPVPGPPLAHEYDMDDARFRIRPYQQVVSSCSGAFITSLTMTPLDVIKTRLQTQQKTLLSDKCFVYCNGLMDHLCPCYPASGTAAGPLNALPSAMGGPTIRPFVTSGPSATASPSAGSPSAGTTAGAIPHYTGTLDALHKISRNEGVKTLWSGLGPTLILAIPATVIYFVFYEQLRLRMKDEWLRRQHRSSAPNAEMPFFIPLVAGMTARITSVTVVNPMELVRTKMQSQRMSYFEVRHALRSVIQHEGYRGLWRGLGPTLCRDVPFSGIYWSTYETIKKYWNVQDTPSVWFSFVSGAAAGCLAAFLTTPFDVVKTHRQIEFGERFLYPDSAVKVQPERTTWQMFANIYRNRGIAGLFAGVTPRLVKISPACAIMIGSFEYGKAFFHERNVATYQLQQQKRRGGDDRLSSDVGSSVAGAMQSSAINLATHQFDAAAAPTDGEPATSESSDVAPT